MSIEESYALSTRASIFAALADPGRLAIVDRLLLADASPSELQILLAMPSNLLAHHLGVLVSAAIVKRTRSEADRRRTYLQLNHKALEAVVPSTAQHAHRILFVCTQNSARSQLAAAIWNRRSPLPATSAGTHPAAQVHPGAVATARRHNLHMDLHIPKHLDDILCPTDLVIAVCDNAHEKLPPGLERIHWSVPDPARATNHDAFDRAFDDLTERIERLAPCLQPY
jgi:protein-tyrosine-phosphatase/DNA-binding transcriptional ArsR family regulator